MFSLLNLLIHLGPLDGYKKIIGIVLMLAGEVVPAAYQGIVKSIGQILAALGLVSDSVNALPVPDALKSVGAFKD
jgi:hypothetical protein